MSKRPEARWVLASSMTIALFAILSPEGAARAEEPPEPDTDEGFGACEKFEERADRELEAWAKEQPKLPYKPQKEETILGGPWVELTRAIAHSSGILAATVLPSIGAQLRDSKPAPTLSFPWSFQVGPAYSCSRDKGTFVVKKHIPNRLMLEPAIVPVGNSVAMWIRPGYRLLVHPSTWVAGFGGGVGSTIDLFGFKNEPGVRASVSPELVVQFGHCCDHGYFTLAVRGDIYFAGQDRFTIGGNAGYTYF